MFAGLLMFALRGSGERGLVELRFLGPEDIRCDHRIAGGWEVQHLCAWGCKLMQLDDNRSTAASVTLSSDLPIQE